MSMKYNGTAWFMMTRIMKKPLRRRYGKAADKYIKDSKEIYRQMLLDADDIGAGNPMKGNIYGAFPIMAVWKAAGGAITTEDPDGIIDEMMHSSLVKKVVGRGDFNDPQYVRRLRASFGGYKKWADEHAEYTDKTWDFNFDDTLHEQGLIYHFTRYPLNDFARKNGFLEVLPCMCRMDYATTALKHGVLHRKNTLAEGGDICDYWFVVDRAEK